MPSGVRISSVNLSGETATVTFIPSTGGTVNVGTQTIPFTYSPTGGYVYGTYQIYIATYDYTYELEVSAPTPTPTATVTPVPTSTPEPTATIAPTSTPAPTATIAPTSTPAPTSASSYTITLIHSTNTYGLFQNNQTLACYSLDCLRNSSCSSSGSINFYGATQYLQVGDVIYFDSGLTSVASNYTGYYIQTDGSPSSIFMYYIVGGEVMSINDCALVMTPTPTQTVTPTSTPVPTSTTAPTSTPAPTSTSLPGNLIFENINTDGIDITGYSSNFSTTYSFDFPITYGETEYANHQGVATGQFIVMYMSSSSPWSVNVYKNGVMLQENMISVGNDLIQVYLSDSFSSSDILKIQLATLTPNPTPTPTLTPTSTITSTPTGYRINLITGTTTYGNFILHQLSACNSLTCLKNSSCSPIGNTVTFGYTPFLQVGDFVYAGISLEYVSTDISGYYIQSGSGNTINGDPSETFLYTIVSGEVTAVDDCSFLTPTPTSTVTNTPTETPIPTPTQTYSYYYDLLYKSTNLSANFYLTRQGACDAYASLQVGATATGWEPGYFVNNNPLVGDSIYSDSTLINVNTNLTGYFIKANTMEVLYIVNGVVSEIVDCSATPTPTVTNTPTETPIPTPTPTPTETENLNPTSTPEPTATTDCTLTVEGSASEIDCTLNVGGSAIPIIDGGGEGLEP